MLALTDWENDYGLPPNVMKGGCPFSGLYDLTPLRYTWLQPKIQLSAEHILKSSPIFNVRSNCPPLLISWGADETSEFWRQSEAFYELYQKAGNQAESYPVEGCDHYSILSTWRWPESPQLARILNHTQFCWE